ncbi:hypothetical protein OAU93_01680 [bacterium]|nr:hypothetical protein [bacterium]
MLDPNSNKSNEIFDALNAYVRIVRECRRVSLQNGFLGDAWDDCSQTGTLEQERAIHFLCSQVDPRIRLKYKPEVRFFIRNIVLNSKDSTK